MGFFSLEVLRSKKPVPLLPRCGPCGLSTTCASPKMLPRGSGKRRVLIVGEAPGKEEDSCGRPFVGEAGKCLRDNLDSIGVDLDEDCLTTNSVICRPPGNATPSDRKIEFCRPNLVRTIKEFDPQVIIPLGSQAVEAVLGWLWKPGVDGIMRWAGWKVPCRKPNAWICPTYHPSYVMRGLKERDTVTQMYFRHHLKEAFSLQERPWQEIPQDHVEIILEDSRAAQAVMGFVEAGSSVAFDYETDRLKPDNLEARIVSCSVSDGTRTVAYPWQGMARQATRELLRSHAGKIASNMRFEERWTMREFGCGVENWIWDTQVAAHVLDSRPAITSIKFQAFVLLGAPDWEANINEYKKSAAPGGNSPNRMASCPLRDLLRYNGLDSLYEWQVAQIQAKQMGVKL